MTSDDHVDAMVGEPVEPYDQQAEAIHRQLSQHRAQRRRKRLMNVGQECARYSCNEEGDRHRCHIVCNRADACGPFQVARSAMAAIIEAAQGPPQDVKEEKDALCNPYVVEGDANGEKGTNWDDKQSSRGVTEVLWRHL